MENTLWPTVIRELEVTVSKANFETWLRPTKLISLDKGIAVVAAPNIFIRGRLESHYATTLLAAIQVHLPDITRLQFVIRPDNPPKTEINLELSLKKESDHQFIAQPTSVVSHHTFTTFVVGNNSRLAYNVSLAVANNPGTAHNPLFLYGGVGLGKTHLMHAIANQILARDPKKKVLYVPCETFTNDYINAIAHKKTDQFKKTYRGLDLLLVDDIQFIANKEGSQEEFFNTFNTLHQSNRQIVIAADRPPKAIPGLEERLSSRFGGGMVADIQTPNLETRTAILHNKCSEKSQLFPPEALTYIATQVQSNIRELEGALNRAIIYCQMNNLPPSLEATRSALSGLLIPTQRRSINPDALLQTSAEHFGITLQDLIGKRRNRELIYPRQMTMFLLREELKLSFPAIARALGGKDHTTIIYGYNKIAALLKTSSLSQRDLSTLKERVSRL